jgi:hypothetical protein
VVDFAVFALACIIVMPFYVQCSSLVILYDLLCRWWLFLNLQTAGSFCGLTFFSVSYLACYEILRRDNLLLQHLAHVFDFVISIMEMFNCMSTM